MESPLKNHMYIEFPKLSIPKALISFVSMLVLANFVFKVLVVNVKALGSNLFFCRAVRL